MWQHQKRSNSARLPQFLNLTTSETKQFCETSSILSTSTRHSQFSKLTTTKTKQFCETSFKNGVGCRADGLVPMRFAIFPLHLCKVLRLPWQRDARSCEVLHLSRKIILTNLEDLMLQNATPLRKSPPWPPNISDEHVSCIAPSTRHASLQILWKCPTPAILFGHATKPSCFCSLLARCKIPCACRAKRHLNVQKWSNYVVFLHFDLEPQRRALFHHLNFQKCFEAGVAACSCFIIQKWSENGVFYTF